MTEETQTQLTPRQIRQAEVDSYAANIAVYTALLATLDGNWDADLIHLKDLPAHTAAEQCPLNRIDRLAKLQQFEQVSRLLKTETLEWTKSKSILDLMP
jgi:hypothetical protein